MKCLLMCLFICLLCFEGISQKGDFSIELSLPSASAAQNAVIVLKVHVCNNGVAGNNYVANSLRVIVSMGSNAEITGISSGSDSRWVLESLTNGTGNTIRVTNKGGTLYGTDCGDILLNVRGTVAGQKSTITSNIAFIAAVNTLLNNGKGAPNAIQGNLSVSNDNSVATLEITAAALLEKAVTSVAVYPNPATDKVNVTGAVAGSNILLFDVNGRLLQSTRASGSSIQEISLTGLNAGNYIIKITGADETKNFKLAKQ